MTIQDVILKKINRDLRQIKDMAECGFKLGYIDAMKEIRKTIKDYDKR